MVVIGVQLWLVICGCGSGVTGVVIVVELSVSLHSQHTPNCTPDMGLRFRDSYNICINAKDNQLCEAVPCGKLFKEMWTSGNRV
jgi:hypothetical protein